MGDFGKISSIDSLPLPEGQHVKDFDTAQAAAKKAAGAAKKAVPPSAVTRQVSPNPLLPAIAAPTFQSVADFVDAYEKTDKTISDLTGKFVDAADTAKQKQADIVPHLAYMQSLLSKKGSNHHLVIEARKNGEKIPWWTDYYDRYKDRLWESLRTMERRIHAYQRDPSVPTIKGNKNGCIKPKHLTQLEHKLLGTATNVHEALTDINAGHIDDAVKKLQKNLPTQDRIDEYLEHGVKPSHDNPDGAAKRHADSSEQQSDNKEPIGLSRALPAGAPVPQSATYEDWEDHRIPDPDFELKYFREASGNFTGRYHYAFKGSAFKKILETLKDKPDQVCSNAQDFANLAAVLRGAADNANLLAAVITSALNLPSKPESGPAPAPAEPQGGPDLTALPGDQPKPREHEPSLATPSKVKQAEAWLQRYLQNGPMPIPDSYIKNGLCRYNYAPDALPPVGIGKKTIDQAIINLGVQKMPSGPKGGMRWHLPEAENTHPETESSESGATRANNDSKSEQES